MLDSRKTTRVAVRCLSEHAVGDDYAEANRLLGYACTAALIFLAGLHIRPLIAGFMMILGRH
jgi:hypothetical protein